MTTPDRSSTEEASNASFDQGFEALETRLMPAVTATFSPTSGALSVFGDSLDNNIQVSRNAAGQLLVNGGAPAGVHAPALACWNRAHEREANEANHEPLTQSERQAIGST